MKEHHNRKFSLAYLSSSSHLRYIVNMHFICRNIGASKQQSPPENALFLDYKLVPRPFASEKAHMYKDIRLDVSN